MLGIQHRFYSRRQKSPDAFSTFKSCQKSNQNEIPHAFLSIKRSKKFLGVYVLPEHENVSLMCFQLYLEKSPCVPFFKNFFTVSIRQKKSSFFSDKIESKIYFWTRIKQAIHMERFVGGGARRLRLNPCMHTCANNLSLKSGSIFFLSFQW